jgi:hypothetical protein
MKLTSKLILCAFTGMVAITACKKEKPVTQITSTPTTPIVGGHSSMLNSIFSSHAPTEQTFVINSSIYQSITGAKGTKIEVYPGAFLTSTGAPVSGMVTVKLIEVLDKKSMLLANASTTSGGKPLISGGEIKLNVWQGIDELKLSPTGNVTVSIPIQGAPDYNMNEYYASVLNANQDFSSPDTTTSITVVSDTTSLTAIAFYSFQLDSLNWVNCDHCMGGIGLQTHVKVTVPPPFKDYNSDVYVVFTDDNSVAGYYHYDASTSSFSPGPEYTILVGLHVTFVAVSEIDGQLYSAFSPAIIINAHNEIMTLTPTTEEQFLLDLDNL